MGVADLGRFSYSVAPEILSPVVFIINDTRGRSNWDSYYIYLTGIVRFESEGCGLGKRSAKIMSNWCEYFKCQCPILWFVVHALFWGRHTDSNSRCLF